MGLINGSLQIGRTALLAQQSALQVYGNNVANAGNPAYTRQSPRLTPLRGAPLAEGFDPGAGVQLSAIERHIDSALEERLRQARSDRSRDEYISSILARLETLYPDLTNNGLSQSLNELFNAFSDLHSTPQDDSARAVAVQAGLSLVERIRTLRKDIIAIRDEVAAAMTEAVDRINGLTTRIADLNVSIAHAQSSGDTAGALKDQRDELLRELSDLVDIQVVEHDTGQITVYVDTSPLIQGNQARTLAVRQTTDGDLVLPEVIFTDNSRKATVSGGRVGAINELITTLVGGNLKDLDTLASGLIFEINKIHSSGQGLRGYTSLTSSNAVSDPTVDLRQAGLAFSPVNGTFLVRVTNLTTGLETVSQITVNLSNLGVQTTLNSLAADLNGVANLQATVLSNGQLRINTTSDAYTVAFAEDSSHVLAALGINGFFTGQSAADIAVNADVASDPRLLACAKQNLPGDGSNAADLALLRHRSTETLRGMSISDYYRAIVGNVGTITASAAQRLEIHSAVADTLQAQREAISGVSLDEETINLMANQRAFQGAARYITIVNDLLQEIMQMI